MQNNYYPFENYPLPYAFNALEPFIDEKTMELHHNRHLQTYIDNLNIALKNNVRLQKLSLEQLLSIAIKLPLNISRNAGGVYNHRFYFEGLTPNTQFLTEGELAKKINETFGSYENFVKQFKDAALSVFGSGYAWLVASWQRKLTIITTKNQENPITAGLIPIINIDVWEHAYYLKHYNKRGDYIDDWFGVANWVFAENNFLTF